MDRPLESEVVVRPCVGGCGRDVPAIELFGSVFPSRCPDCLAEAEAKDSAKLRAERVATLMGRAKLGERMRGWSLASYPKDGPGQKALAAARAWLEGFRAGSKAGLLLAGPVGSGKTGLAWGIARELIEVDLVEANVANWRDMLAEMRDAFGQRRHAELAIKRVPVLFLDDLGAERPTDWALDELATLVEWRYQRELVTCATSNYDPDELGSRLGHDDLVVGQRIMSRLTDGAVQVFVNAPDRRRV